MPVKYKKYISGNVVMFMEIIFMEVRQRKRVNFEIVWGKASVCSRLHMTCLLKNLCVGWVALRVGCVD